MTKRKVLSLIRLYKMANSWIFEAKTKDQKQQRYDIITNYLKYVNEHKYDEL